MKKSRASILITAFVLGSAFAAAEDPAPTPTPAPAAEVPDASKVILAPKRESTPAPAADSDGITRSVSPGIAQALSEGMPKFSPPTPTPTPAAEEEDKPKNGIIRLPAYLVREKRPPIFRPKDLYTPAGLIDLTFKAHPGLIFGNILGLNEGAAAQMYLDDQRSSNIDDLTDMAHAMAQGGDHAEGAFIMRQSDSTYLRDGASDWSATGPVGSLTGAGK